MLLGPKFEAFVEQSPVSVMMRGLVEKFFHPERVDRLFEEHAVMQYTWQLPFSTVAEVLAEVVFNVSPSVGASLQEREGELPVSRRAFYKKLNGVEPAVGRALVSDSARQLEPVLAALGMRTRPILRGHRTRILDGNHFAATEHRLEVLRHDTAAPLPGQALAILDADRRLVRDVIPCEDGHAQERSLLVQVLPLVCRNDLWLADRNFCTLGFVCGIARVKARLLIRLHASMPYRTVRKRRKCGRTETGTVYEERIVIVDPETGRDVSCRLVTLVLDTPTRDGETEIKMITNLTVKAASAIRVAELYRQRWTIESMFQDLTTHLSCEIRTLAYPKAAVFAFCLALLAWNLISVLLASLGAVHGEDSVKQNVSGYYLSLEISQVHHGMMIAIPEKHWTVFRTLTPAALAKLLKTLAAKVNLAKYQSHPRTPKKPQPKRTRSGNGQHIATAKLLCRMV
jgi:hypothetical protein